MLFKIHKKTPIVIFPEGTKTNGNGVLDIEKDILKIIEKAASPEEN
jgi:1-acyl-sn-glycerol-3-phosphate acyltransferase